MTDFPIYLFILLVFANRYLFGLYLSLVKGKKLDARVDGYEPTITVVVPLHNEGRSIGETILSLVRLAYPADKLTITVVDDCSTDDSYQWACKAASEHPNVTVLRTPYNMGKRKAIDQAVRQTRAEIIVSVDPDLIVFPTALRELVARFTGPEVAAVGGRVHVSNPNQNWLTRLQTIKYYVGQEHVNNLERSLRSVMRLSGRLTAYRRSVLMQLAPALEDRSPLGVSILEAGYRTTMTTDAMCFT
ncbi:MAG TPA: glycosyltransferase family 2 protein, partial [Kofleriaceae bacterium]|nr:glycosyltransferase family 2 protein [Kofleriaceae bacterium]